MAYIQIQPQQITGGGNGQILTSDDVQWNDMVSVNSDMIEFLELVLIALGHDITYGEFNKMSKEEKKSLIRDIKLNKVLDVNS